MTTTLSTLLVIDSLGSGGAQRQIVSLACGLSDRGAEVTLFNYYPALDHFRNEVEAHGIVIVDAPKVSRLDISPFFKLRELLATNRFDVAVSFLDTPNLYLIGATLLRNRTKAIVSERMMFADGLLTMKTWAKYQAYRFADAITVNSVHQRNRIQAKFRWSNNKLVTIWNGVDLKRYAPVRRSPAHSPLRGSTIIAAGTIDHRKNAFNLIKAARIALDGGANFELHWAGKVQPNSDGRREIARCEALISELGLGNHWKWMGECTDMHEVYPRYDFVVHPSFVEGLPNVICEGLACGLPFVASNTGDHALLADGGRNGFLFEPNDPDSIAAALIKVASLSQSEYNSMSESARSFAESRLGRDTLVDTYERLMLKLISS